MTHDEKRIAMRRHDELLAKRQALYDRAIAEGREMTATEKREDAELQQKANELHLQLEAAQIEAERRGEPSREQIERVLLGDGAGGESSSRAPELYRSSKGPFAHFGDFLGAVAEAGRPGGREDSRLREVRAASGLNEGIPSEGGFLLQADLGAEILRGVFGAGQLASRCRVFNISEGSNSILLPAVDESSRKDGYRWGGISMSWLEEAGVKPASKPLFRKMELKPKKLAGICYSTDELLQDKTVLGQFLSIAFTDEISFRVDDAIYRGTGAGMPLGILNSPCLVTVAKELGQPAATLLYENILKMFARFSGDPRRAAWVAHKSIIPQLYAMSLAVGVGGVPVYMPAGGIAGSPYATLFGLPLLFLEQAAVLGTVGDIMLGDLAWYGLATKGGVQSAMSMHVRFIYDESCFRFVYRVDGQPLLGSALTPFSGTDTVSPFVVLATRA